MVSVRISFNPENGQIEIGTNRERAKKGKGIHGKNPIISDYVVLDLETTDKDVYSACILQVGMLRVRDGKIVDQYSTYVDPEMEIPEETTAYNGITNSMVENAPLIEDVLPGISKFIGDDVIVGHNINRFDLNLLYDMFLENDLPPLSNNFIDTLDFSKRFFPKEKFPGLVNYQLGTLIEYFNLPTGAFHDALKDCYHNYNFYEFAKDYLQENNLIDEINKSKRQNTHFGTKAKDILPTVTEYDVTHPVYGKCFVFTGDFNNCSRSDAILFVKNHGGDCSDSVSRKVDYLVLGDLSNIKSVKDGKSTKQKKAEELIQKGDDIQIITEKEFIEMSGIL